MRAIHCGEAAAVLEITATLLATAEHPICANGQWTAAGNLRPGDMVVGSDESYSLAAAPRLLPRKTAVFDLSVDPPHNFFAGGLLVHNKSMGFDRWKLFHVAASPYENQIADRGYLHWIVVLAVALAAAAVAIYATRRRGVDTSLQARKTG